MVKSKTLDECMFLSRPKKEMRRKKLDQLCDYFNLKRYMGELFLSETKVNPHDIDARRVAKTLGLLPRDFEARRAP
ncbi:unnamed protein product [marine sediment metagenome]|uniref:Uncharacterized protein n=1 Tax=marine sediment metagenome TaxID=412755 RepID=X0X8J5_9ZZZZ